MERLILERKAHNSLTEAALQVQLGDTQEPEINEVDPMVLEYFNNYFDGDLNEDTFEEDILEAVDALVELCADVCEAVGLEEKIIKPKSRIFRHEKSPTGVDLGATIYHGKDARPDDFAKRGVFVPPKYANSKTPIRTLKPSPEQLRTAMANKADNSPLLQTGQGTNTKTVRPSDIQNKARAKRITRMKKFGK